MLLLLKYRRMKDQVQTQTNGTQNTIRNVIYKVFQPLYYINPQISNSFPK